jgi:hypothetical protein
MIRVPTIWLKTVEEALKTEGFVPTVFQEIKAGQVFELVKNLPDGWQMHVRGFENGRLEAEIEISRWYLEHLCPCYPQKRS